MSDNENDVFDCQTQQVVDGAECLKCPHISSRHKEQPSVCQEEQVSKVAEPFKCPHCPYIAFKGTFFKAHLLSRHKYEPSECQKKQVVSEAVEPFKCPHCPFDTHNQGSFKRHINSHKLSLVCQKCSFKAAKKAKLFRHEMEAHGESLFTTYKCSECDFYSCPKFIVKQHEANAHKDTKKFNCTLCKYSTNYELCLRSHLLKKHQVTNGEEPLQCPYCEYDTFGPYILKKHISSRHKSQPLNTEKKEHSEPQVTKYTCSKCDFSSHIKETVKRHVRVAHEDNAARFVYQICKYSTEHRITLKSHLLKKHQVIEGGEPLKCPQCPYNTVYVTQLKVHIAQHKQSFICQKCPFEAQKKSIFFRHEIDMHGESSFTMYKCSRCNYSSYYKVVVKRHERNVHEANAKFH